MKYMLLASVSLLLGAEMAQSRNIISDCLHGKNRSVVCQKIVQNYWRHNAAMEQIARQHGIPVSYFKALIAYESGYNEYAKSHVGAKGLTQVMPATADYLNVSYSHLNNPTVSLHAGAKFLAELQRKFNGNWPLILAAYNSGPNRVARLGRVPNISETQNYVRNIMALEKSFRAKQGYQPQPQAAVQTSSGDAAVSNSSFKSFTVGEKSQKAVANVTTAKASGIPVIAPKPQRVNQTLDVRTKYGVSKGKTLVQGKHYDLNTGKGRETAVAVVKPAQMQPVQSKVVSVAATAPPPKPSRFKEFTIM